MSLHRHRHTMKSILIPQLIKLRTRRRHRHHLIPHRPHLDHHITCKIQGLWNSNGANYLVFIVSHRILLIMFWSHQTHIHLIIRIYHLLYIKHLRTFPALGSNLLIVLFIINQSLNFGS